MNIWEAAKDGYCQRLSQLLSEGINVNSLDKSFQSTALIYACQEGHLDVVQLLLDRNADITIQDVLNQSALSAAELSKNDEIIALVSSLKNDYLKRCSAD